MYILKSRNPIWLILDVIIAILLWKIGIIVAALFFTIDSFLQLVYTFFPDALDALDKNKKFRFFYTIFMALALFFIVRYLTAERII